MKHIFLALIVLSAIACKAQSPIYPSYDNSEYGEIKGAYYKDINNFLDQYLGTWVFTNENTILKVVFKKVNMYRTIVGDLDFYEDFLVGEYQYVENGIQKNNSLAAIDNNYKSIYNYNLFGNLKIKPTSYPRCNECSTGESRLVLNFNEPSRRYGHGLDSMGPAADFIIRRVVENGIVKIKAQLISTRAALDAPSPELEKFSLPYGDYTLIKQ